MSLELCFYRGTGKLDRVIRWWSGRFSHVEFRFDGVHQWGALPGAVSGWCALKIADLSIAIECTQQDEERLRGWCDEESGCAYDWKGILLSQILNRARSHPGEWFCSEACVAGLAHLDKLPKWLKPCTVSPSYLADIFTTPQSPLRPPCLNS